MRKRISNQYLQYHIYSHKSRWLREIADTTFKSSVSEHERSMLQLACNSLVYNDSVYRFMASGIAATQIGSKHRFIVTAKLQSSYSSKASGVDMQVLLNPEITDRSAEMQDSLEGCLSFEPYQCYVPRHKQIEIKYLDIQSGLYVKETVSGEYANVVQHEIDHLDGVTMIDRSTKTIVNPFWPQEKRNRKLR